MKPDNPIEDGLYIIAFQTERNKWNYTNKGYPTEYSGRVYIDKENFAIIKVVENWETNLNKDEIEKHFKGYKNIVSTTIKEENICYYSDIVSNGKLYATRYFNRRYDETLDKYNNKNYGVFERDSYLFDFELKNVEKIEYEWREKKQTVLNRVEYDESFWNSLYKRESKGKTK